MNPEVAEYTDAPRCPYCSLEATDNCCGVAQIERDARARELTDETVRVLVVLARLAEEKRRTASTTFDRGVEYGATRALQEALFAVGMHGQAVRGSLERAREAGVI